MGNLPKTPPRDNPDPSPSPTPFRRPRKPPNWAWLYQEHPTWYVRERLASFPPGLMGGREAAILYALASMMQPDLRGRQTCFASKQTLGEYLGGASAKTVQRGIARLKSLPVKYQIVRIWVGGVVEREGFSSGNQRALRFELIALPGAMEQAPPQPKRRGRRRAGPRLVPNICIWCKVDPPLRGEIWCRTCKDSVPAETQAEIEGREREPEIPPERREAIEREREKQIRRREALQDIARSASQNRGIYLNNLREGVYRDLDPADPIGLCNSRLADVGEPPLTEREIAVLVHGEY